jgi:hypothetical protein
MKAVIVRPLVISGGVVVRDGVIAEGSVVVRDGVIIGLETGRVQIDGA